MAMECVVPLLSAAIRFGAVSTLDKRASRGDTGGGGDAQRSVDPDIPDACSAGSRQSDRALVAIEIVFRIGCGAAFEHRAKDPGGTSHSVRRPRRLRQRCESEGTVRGAA